MSLFLGIDTSNYTTSVALLDGGTGEIFQQKQLLPVETGKLGLRQSDAVFHHVRQLAPLLEELLNGATDHVAAICASERPVDQDGSYMPCFLVGLQTARSMAAILGVPMSTCSHQAGHVAAALYDIDRPELFQIPFLAFHLSGGTTQCLLVNPDREQILTIQQISGTKDLNAGQVVDRVGLLLGLQFPAGPHLEKLALQSDKQYTPKPTFRKGDCCLSGLENQCAHMYRTGEPPQNVARYCLDALAQMLLELTSNALTLYPDYPLVYAGGVMSNTIIRSTIEQAWHAHFARPALSSDNAAGVAVIGAIRNGGYTPC